MDDPAYKSVKNVHGLSKNSKQIEGKPFFPSLPFEDPGEFRMTAWLANPAMECFKNG